MATTGKRSIVTTAQQDEAAALGNQALEFHAAALAASTTEITPTSGDVRANSTTAGTQRAASVAALTGGGYVITWHGPGDGSGSGVYAQRYDASGNAVGSEFRVNAATASDQAFASVAALTNGGFVVTWESFNQDGSDFGIYGQRYDANGNAVGAEFRANTTTSGQQATTAVAALTGGGFVVTWNSPDGSDLGIYGQRYAANGSPAGSEFKVSTTVTGQQYFSYVADLADGGFLVVWESAGLDGSALGIAAQRYNSAGGAVGGQFQVNTFSAGDQWRPVAASLEGGGFVVVWQSASQDGSDAGVYARLYSAAGAAIGGEFRINETTAQSQSLPSVTAIAGGGFMVAWTSGPEVLAPPSDPVDGVELDIYARYFDADGSAVGGEFRVNQTTAGTQVTNYGERQGVAQLSNGEIVFAWEGNGTGDAHGIFSRRFAIDTNDPPDAVNDSPSTSEDQAVQIGVRANDFDPDGDTLTITAVSTPSHGTAAINVNGTITYTPTANYNGADSFTYSVSDGNGGTDTATVNVTVAAVNDAPDAVNDTSTVNEDGFVDIAVRSNDTDIENNALTVTAVGTPAHGTAAIVSGNVRYTPSANYNGSDSFTYTISDGAGGTDTATVNVTVNPVNDPPVAGDDSATTDEDVAFAIDVLSNDSDIDGIDTLSVSAVGAAAHGSVAINANGTIQYTPNANYNGSDSFTYTLSDGKGGTDTATVSLTINPVNDTPAPAADARLINENTFVDINVRANDTDIDGDALTVSAVGSAANGTTAINPDGTVRYTPNADFFGVDSFSYTVSDGAGGSANATVTVTVNNIPEARYDRAVTIEEQAVTFQVVANDKELDGDALFVSAVSQGAHGSVAIAGSGQVTYTPTLNFVGVDSFTYTVADGRGGFDTETVTVTVEEVVDDGELMVNPVSAAGLQDETTIAALADGGWVVVYHQYTGKDIYARVFGSDGVPIGEAFKVNKADLGTNDDSESDATVVGLADGGFVVVYTSEDFDGTATAVAARRYDANGVPMGDEFLVGPSMTTARDSSSIGALTDGGFVIAYSEGQNLAVQRFGQDGSPDGSRQIISLNYSYGTPAVAGLAGGGYVVTEQGYFDAGESGYGIIAYLFDADGALVTGPFSLTQTNNITETDAAVAGLANGGFVAVWERTDGDSGGVYARRFNADGSAAGDTFLVPTVIAASQYKPSVAGFPDGRFIINWTSIGQDGDTTGQSNIYAQIYAADGTPLGAPFRANETIAGNQTNQGNVGSTIPHNPTVAVLADSTIAFSWWGNGEGASDGTFTRRFTTDGLKIGSGGADSLSAGPGQDVVQGLGGDDTLSGLLGNDQLLGGDGNDVLIGGPGNDTLNGGNGTDTASYVTAPAGVTVNLGLAGAQNTTGAWTDTLISIENVTGSDWSDTLRGHGGANVLTGGGEGDDLDGAGGADVFVYLDPTDSVAGARDRIRTFQSGIDKIDLSAVNPTLVTWSSVSDSSGSYTLVLVQTPTGPMEIRVDGSVVQADFIAPGAFPPNTVTGTAAADILVGTPNVDLMFGLDGNDQINGDASDDTLDGGAGADSLRGNAGDDTYIVERNTDAIIELAGEGTDTVQSNVGFILPAEVENLVLIGTDPIAGTGNGLANAITGNSAANVLNGGAGADSLSGGGGNDTYYVDNAGDVVTEISGVGTDLVRSTVTFTLADFVENLTLDGSADIDGTGNSLVNTIFGTSGNNLLNGLGGADTMRGLAGNDIYVVDNIGDKVLELADEGTDTVQSSVGLTLLANVENLTLTGAANINGAGNVLDNALTGNSGANLLNGLAGADTMNGGDGNDTYIVDNALDTAVESSAAGGTDTVQSAVTFTLGIHIENLTLTGAAAINGTGNTLANDLNGNNAANVLDGGAGADDMRGGGGNDLYLVDHSGDLTIETGSTGGTDTVQTALSWTLGAFVENLVLTGVAAVNGAGNDLANTLTGNGASNLLNGATGADTMNGGDGDDTYVVDNLGDQAVEASAVGGTDLVQSSVSFTLGNNVENLTLTGSASANGTGNALANTINGNTGSNILDGKAGADTMRGGNGNDIYVVDNAGDVVSESSATGGTDTVQSAITLTLGNNVENLTLTGAGAVNGTGNALANALAGNAAANQLNGLAGNDTLQGGGGADGFLFTTALGAGNVDAIMDFAVVDDTIFLDNAVFAGLAAGALAAGAFRTGAAAADADDRIIYNAATGALYFDADGDGAGAQVQFATLATGLAMTAGDFTVI